VGEGPVGNGELISAMNGKIIGPEPLVTATPVPASLQQQNKSIPDEHDAMRNHAPGDQAFTSALGDIGRAVPAVQTTGEYSPAEIHADIRLTPGAITVVHAGLDVTTRRPTFNHLRPRSLGNMISDDTLPSYQQFIHDAERLTCNWSVHVRAGLGG
jgi:hypothetical protein